MSDSLAWFEEKVSAAADIAFCEYCRDLQTSQYLYYMQGDLVVGPDAQPYMRLVTPERIPRHLDRDGLRAWIHTRARKVPCLPLG